MAIGSETGQTIKFDVHAGGKKVELELFKLRPDQKEIVDHPARIKVVNCGRRYGKSSMVIFMAICCFLQGGRVAWIAPKVANSRAPWDLLTRILLPLTRSKIITHDKKDNIFKAVYGLGQIALYNKTTLDSISGQPFHLIIVDEAAQFTKKDIEQNILPCLADTQGPLVLVSTPRGRNYYFEYWQRGQKFDEEGHPNPLYDSEYMSWKRPSSMNPMPTIQAEVETARRTVGWITFQQEWLAEFINDGGEVFSDIDSSMRGNENMFEPIPGGRYLMVVDPGRSDPLEISIFDLRDQRQVCLRRFVNLPFHRQYDLIQELYEQWCPVSLVIEQNRGAEMIEEMGRRGIPVKAVNMDNGLKCQMVDKLAAKMASHRARLVQDPELKRQLGAFQCTRTARSGLFTYGAPKGDNDDAVIVTMIGIFEMDGYGVSATYGFADCPRLPMPLAGNLAAFLSTTDTTATVAIVSSFRGHFHIHRIVQSPLGSESILSVLETYPILGFGLDKSNKKVLDSRWHDWIARRVEAGERDLPSLKLVERDRDVQKRVLATIQGPLAARRVSVSPTLTDSTIFRELLDPRSPASDAAAGAFFLAEKYESLAAA